MSSVGVLRSLPFADFPLTHVLALPCWFRWHLPGICCHRVISHSPGASFIPFGSCFSPLFFVCYIDQFDLVIHDSGHVFVCSRRCFRLRVVTPCCFPMVMLDSNGKL